MDRLFLTIINMSLTGAFVIAAVCLARLPLKKAPKIISYCLWAVVAFRLVCPFSFESAISFVPFNTQSIPPTLVSEHVNSIDTGIVQIDEPANNFIGQMGEEWRGTTSESWRSYPLRGFVYIGAYLWLIGAIAMVIYGVVSYLILKRKMRGMVHVESNIYESEIIESPFVLGVFDPRIYLPVGLSEKERGYIILHEQTHIKRRDYIVKFAAYFILCIHWFNPLAWVAFLLMGVDMEMSCDERVLKEMGSETKKDYSLSLLSLATERRFVSGSPLAFGEGGVKQRIKNVLNFRKPSRIIIVAAVALVTVLIAGFAVNRISGDNPSYLEITELMNATQEEVYQKLGSPQESLNGTDIFIINGKTISMTYDENLRVNQINYNGESVVNALGVDDNYVWNQLSLDDVRALAAKGDALQYSDLPNLRPSLLSSTMGGYNPTLYGVEGGYRLLVSFYDTANPKSGISSIQLESIWQNGGSGIDIRYSDVDEFIRLNPSHPADTVPSTTFQPRKWIDRENNEYSLTTSHDLMLDEFPGVIFSYTPERLIATNDSGEKELFGGTDGFIFGGYIGSVFLADLNGDGNPEFCSSTDWGSGFGDSRVIVYDYHNDTRYVLSDRFTYDYYLEMEHGQLEAIQTSPMQMNDTLGIGRLAIIDGELVVFGIDRTQPITAPQPTTSPTYEPWMSSWPPLSDLPADYSMEQAIADSVVVIAYDGTHNQQQVDLFYSDVATGGGAAFMRVMQQTIEGDVIITDYQYDGDVFTVTHDSTRDRFSAQEDRIIITRIYKYLVPLDRSRPSGNSLPYYLSNEENIYTAAPDGQGTTLIEDLWWIPPPSDNYMSE